MSRYAKALLKYYDDIGHRVGEFLRPGIPLTKQRKALNEFRRRLPRWFCREFAWFCDDFPPALPPALTALYEWRNGIRHASRARLGNLDFVPTYYLVSLAEALDDWRIVTEAVRDSEMYGNENTVFLGASPFPFMHDGTGNYVVLDIRNSSPTYGSVGCFDKTGSSSRRAEYGSLPRFFQAHYQCCKEGVYRLDKDGYLDRDYKKAERILARHRMKGS